MKTLTDLTLITTSVTPSSMRVSLFLAEKGLEIATQEINVRQGDNLADDFKQKSINGLIPLLKLENGQYLSESLSICRYIDEREPDELGLFGFDTLSRAQVDMWNRVLEWQALIPAFQAFRNITAIYKDRERCVSAWGEESKLRVSEFLPRLEARLQESAYVGCDRFSCADITAFIFLRMCSALEVEWQQYPALKAWFDTVASRPAFQQ
ncbi:glutathione S-transferase family protein [Paraferrimonas haliotis]|uniref:Glutathione S-transferase n=1 Tax=Paraferrimonas haliotis TaxID=2013866 RepID=A0AA37TKZ4_9GAMM|nr:glutathione S-transferase N-terminal domain-containing protein [Paraferrimonas haliotis]GLS83422.1 glutathione S-transferase [Paraferrimonas haliotis]